MIRRGIKYFNSLINLIIAGMKKSLHLYFSDRSRFVFFFVHPCDDLLYPVGIIAGRGPWYSVGDRGFEPHTDPTLIIMTSPCGANILGATGYLAHFYLSTLFI